MTNFNVIFVIFLQNGRISEIFGYFLEKNTVDRLHRKISAMYARFSYTFFLEMLGGVPTEIFEDSQAIPEKKKLPNDV